MNSGDRESENPHALAGENKNPQSKKEGNKRLQSSTEGEQTNTRYKRSTFTQLLPRGSVDIDAGKKRNNIKGKGKEKGQIQTPANLKDSSRQKKPKKKKTHVPESGRTRLSVQVHIARLSDGKRDGIEDKSKPSEDATQVSNRNTSLQKKTKCGQAKRTKKSPASNTSNDVNAKRGTDAVKTPSEPKLANTDEEWNQERHRDKPDGKVTSGKEPQSKAANKSSKAKVGLRPRDQKKPSGQEKTTMSSGETGAEGLPASKPKSLASSQRLTDSTSSRSDNSFSPDPHWQKSETSSSDSGPIGNVFITQAEGREAELVGIGKEVGFVNESPFGKKDCFSLNSLEGHADALHTKGEIVKYVDNVDPNGQKEAPSSFSFKSTGAIFGQKSPECFPGEDKSTSTISALSVEEDITVVADVRVSKKKQMSQQSRRARASTPKAAKKTDMREATKKTSPVGRPKSAVIASSGVKPTKNVGTSKSEVGNRVITKSATTMKSRGPKKSPSSERRQKSVHNSPSKPGRRLLTRENAATGKQKAYDGVTNSVRKRNNVKQRDTVSRKGSDDDGPGMMPIDCPVVTDVAMKGKSKVRFKLPDGTNPYESDLSTSSDRSVMSETYEASSSASPTNSEIAEYHESSSSSGQNKQCSGNGGIGNYRRSQTYYDNDYSKCIGMHDSFYDSDSSSCNSGKGQSDGYSDCSTCSGRYDRSRYNSDCSTCNSSRSMSISDRSSGPYTGPGTNRMSPSSDFAKPIPRSQPFFVPSQSVRKASSPNNKKTNSTSRAKSSGSLSRTYKHDATSPTPSVPRCYSAQHTTKRSFTNLPLRQSAELSKVDLSKVPPHLMMYAVPLSAHPKSEAQLLAKSSTTTTITKTHTRPKSKNAPEQQQKSTAKLAKQQVNEARDRAHTNTKRAKDVPVPRKQPNMAKSDVAKKPRPGLKYSASEGTNVVKREPVKSTRSSTGTTVEIVRHNKDTNSIVKKQDMSVKRKQAVKDKASYSSYSETQKKQGRITVDAHPTQGGQRSKVRSDGERKVITNGQTRCGQGKEIGIAVCTRRPKPFIV